MTFAGDPFGLIGQVLDGQFRIDKFVGEGGFSVVYRGHHLGLDEPIALKCLKLPMTLGSALVESFVRRFREESRLHYRLSQGNLFIARSIAGGTTMAPATGALVPYIALEWLEGRSLANDLEVRRTYGDRGRSLGDVVRILDSAIDALAYAHAQGVVHRDVNPGNLFLTQTPQGTKLKVLDFGVAKIVIDHLALGPRQQTLGKIKMFSPTYASPEQFDENIGQVGPWTDVYALALIGTELLRDAPAIEGNTLSDYHAKTMDPETRPTPRTLGVVIGDAVEAAFAHALDVVPGHRPQDAGEFWGELKNAMQRDQAAGFDYTQMVPPKHEARRSEQPPVTVAVPSQPTAPGSDDERAAKEAARVAAKAALARTVFDPPSDMLSLAADGQEEQGPDTAREPEGFVRPASKIPPRAAPRPGPRRPSAPPFDLPAQNVQVSNPFPEPRFPPPPSIAYSFSEPAPPSLAISSGTPTLDPPSRDVHIPPPHVQPPHVQPQMQARVPAPHFPPTQPVQQFPMQMPVPRTRVQTPLPPQLQATQLQPMDHQQAPVPLALARTHQTPLPPDFGQLAPPPIPNAFGPGAAPMPGAAWAPPPSEPVMSYAAAEVVSSTQAAMGYAQASPPQGFAHPSFGQPQQGFGLSAPEPGFAMPAPAPQGYDMQQHQAYGMPQQQQQAYGGPPQQGYGMPQQQQQQPYGAQQLQQGFGPEQPNYGVASHGLAAPPQGYVERPHPESLGEMPTRVGQGAMASFSPLYPSRPPPPPNELMAPGAPNAPVAAPKKSRAGLVIFLLILVLALLGGGFYAVRRFHLLNRAGATHG